MPFYLVQSKFSRDSVKGLMNNPQDRTKAVSKLLEAVGGKLHHFFFAFGEYDTVVLVEAPDNASAAAVAMVVAGSGAVSAVKTTVLLTIEESMASMKTAGTASAKYQPPGA
jgi:uncharacterized protein with GYD domain